MTSPPDRTVRFSLRLAPDEMAACEDAQERMGGTPEVSLNTAIAVLLTEGYHHRTMPQDTPVLPVSPMTLARVQWVADVSNCTLANALDMLVSRGMPHDPGLPCNHKAPGVPAPTPPAAIAPPRLVPPTPRYATPRPTGLPPVAPVPGQAGIDIEGEHQ